MMHTYAAEANYHAAFTAYASRNAIPRGFQGHPVQEISDYFIPGIAVNCFPASDAGKQSIKLVSEMQQFSHQIRIFQNIGP